MVQSVSKTVEELEGKVITCPLCRSEEVELGTTKKDALQGYCAVQRSPFFLNNPRKLDSDLLSDDMTEEGSGEKGKLEQEEESEDIPRRKENTDPEDESDDLEQDPAGWCPWCGEPIMESEVSENSDGKMEADHGFEDCDAMGMGLKKTHVY